MLRIRLYASKVSATCGMNHYCSPESVSEEIMERMSLNYVPPEPSVCTKLLNFWNLTIVPKIKSYAALVAAAFRTNNSHTTDDPSEESVQRTFLPKSSVFANLSDADLCRLADLSGCLLSGDVDKDVKNCVETLGITCSGLSFEECNTIETELLGTLCSGIRNQELREHMKRIISSSIATQRGIKFEKRDLDAFAKKIGQDVNHQGEKFTEEFRVHSSNIVFVIVGKLDGKVDGHVVETKHRRHRLFGNIPLYERVQLETYMWLTETQYCTHIENFGDRSNVTLYEHDPELWERVSSGLCEFGKLMRKKIGSDA